MATRFHPVLDQVDGVTDTFELPEPFIIGSVSLAYNGQIFDKGTNIVAEDPNGNPATVQLTFVPESDTQAMMLIYECESTASGGGIRGFTHPPGGLLNDF